MPMPMPVSDTVMVVRVPLASSVSSELQTMTAEGCAVGPVYSGMGRLPGSRASHGRSGKDRPSHFSCRR